MSLPKESNARHTIKAYHVERISRTATTVLVYASTGSVAREMAARGEGEEVDSLSLYRGIGRVRRAPEEDDFGLGI